MIWRISSTNLIGCSLPLRIKYPFMAHLKKNWRIMLAFSVLGLVVACLNVTYLWVTYPHRNPTIENVFDLLCRPSVLTIVCMDVPCTNADYAKLWAVAAILNAAIYGIVGGLLALCVSHLRLLLKHVGVRF